MHGAIRQTRELLQTRLHESWSFAADEGALALVIEFKGLQHFLGYQLFFERAQTCARKLLEVRDRVESDELRLTHEFIAEILAVRRAGVTEALVRLNERGLIDCTRGHTIYADQGS